MKCWSEWAWLQKCLCVCVCVYRRKRGKSSGKRHGEASWGQRKKKRVKSDLYFATWKSTLRYVYIFLVSRIYEFRREIHLNFLFNGRRTRTSIRGCPDALTTYPPPPPPPEEISETRILSQFCRGMVQLRTMNNDRLTDFFSCETFAAAAAAIALWQLPNDTPSLPSSRSIYKRYVNMSTDRPRYNVLWYILLYIFVHLSPPPVPLKPRRIYWAKNRGKQEQQRNGRYVSKKFYEKKIYSCADRNAHFLHGLRKYQIFAGGILETREAIPRYDFMGLSISLESQLTLGF